MLIALIMMMFIFPAAVACGYDLVNKDHTEADVHSVWTGALLCNAALIAVYVMFFC